MTTTTTPLASLSLSCRATLNVHSLNNEGGEGNQIQTRMVDIVDAAGVRHSVNAISGDMMRHMLAENLLRVAVQRGLPLSEGARRLDANRINADPAAMKAIGEKNSDPEALDYLLNHCAITDMMGTLITKSKRSLPRPSVVEFGWVVGMPAQVHSANYFHVKYSADRGSDKRRQDADESEATGSNRGQAIFHRPASSGVYALVCHLELARIGYNDIRQGYAVDDEERTTRAHALLDAVLYTLLEMNGAMRAAQLPHLTALSGVVATSSGIVPAPLISPLASSGHDHKDDGQDHDHDYRGQVQTLVGLLDGQNGSTLAARPFEDITGFATIMQETTRNLVVADLTPRAASAR